MPEPHLASLDSALLRAGPAEGLALEMVEIIRRKQHQYKHYICVDLATERYNAGVRQHLEAKRVYYLRVPFKDRNEVYYLLRKLEDVGHLRDALNLVREAAGRVAETPLPA